MECLYIPVAGKQERKGVLKNDYSLYERRSIMMGLANEIENYMLDHNRKPKIRLSCDRFGARGLESSLNGVRIKSLDGCIDALIEYHEPREKTIYLSACPAAITVELEFNSTSKTDLQEYKGLYDIVMGIEVKTWSEAIPDAVRSFLEYFMFWRR